LLFSLFLEAHVLNARLPFCQVTLLHKNNIKNLTRVSVEKRIVFKSFTIKNQVF